VHANKPSSFIYLKYLTKGKKKKKSGRDKASCFQAVLRDFTNAAAATGVLYIKLHPVDLLGAQLCTNWKKQKKQKQMSSSLGTSPLS